MYISKGEKMEKSSQTAFPTSEPLRRSEFGNIGHKKLSCLELYSQGAQEVNIMDCLKYFRVRILDPNLHTEP